MRRILSYRAYPYLMSPCLVLGLPSMAFAEEADILDVLGSEVLAAVQASRQREHERRAQWQRQQVVRARYEAELARRRYTAVDPENRLVAAELERQWDVALIALREAEEAAARFAERPTEPELAPELRERLAHLSQTLPALWAEEGVSNESRKRLLRSLIARVILKRKELGGLRLGAGPLPRGLERTLLAPAQALPGTRHGAGRWPLCPADARAHPDRPLGAG